MRWDGLASGLVTLCIGGREGRCRVGGQSSALKRVLRKRDHKQHVWYVSAINLPAGQKLVAIQPIPVNSRDEWLELCRRYRDDALALRRAKRPDGAWLNAGFAVECYLKAAVMKKERLNRWPDKDSAPDLWSHDLRGLFKRLGIDPLGLDPNSQVAAALKMVLDWRREHGYSVGKLPIKFADSMCRAAFEANGVVEWIAGLYRLDI
jgi:hypothetical protein